jgi:hypothetical protein
VQLHSLTDVKVKKCATQPSQTLSSVLDREVPYCYLSSFYSLLETPPPCHFRPSGLKVRGEKFSTLLDPRVSKSRFDHMTLNTLDENSLIFAIHSLELAGHTLSTHLLFSREKNSVLLCSVTTKGEMRYSVTLCSTKANLARRVRTTSTTSRQLILCDIPHFDRRLIWGTNGSSLL